MGLEEILSNLLESIEANVVNGLTGCDREQVIRDLRFSIRKRLEGLQEEDWPRFADFVKEEILEDLQDLTPNDRRAYAAAQAFRLKLQPLDYRARELSTVFAAQLAHDQIAPEDAIKALARSIKEQIIDLADDLARDWPELKTRYAFLISEAKLDCEYILTDGNVASIRLGRHLQQEQIS